MLKPGKRLWALVLVGWVLIGMTFTLNYYLYADHYVFIFTKQPTFIEMLVWELPYWLLWAGLSPLIFKITRRHRIERERWMASLAVHVGACVLFSCAHRAAYLLIGWGLNVVAYRPIPSLADLFDFLFFFNMPTALMSYATILLVSHALLYYQRYQEEELKASRLKAELAEAQLQITEAQLQALKMQLHPHFLFNTLNSISALLDEDAEAADEMLARLGDLLRMTLANSGAQEVTLQEELEFLRCYLEIERVRFQDRLTVQMDIEPQALDALVPNLILQPIVENAIRHGIASRIAPGRIEVRAARAGDALRLQVEDNGPGIQAKSDLAVTSREGVGLSNTRARLKRLYGDCHRFELSDAVGGGLLLTIEIPFQTEAAASVSEQKVAFT
ncbi:MAG TPA: histidine kinase [Blastocatellia bacterium]|nr:histidine kinase [Blastocatellia bacterium]